MKLVEKIRKQIEEKKDSIFLNAKKEKITYEEEENLKIKKHELIGVYSLSLDKKENKGKKIDANQSSFNVAISQENIYDEYKVATITEEEIGKLGKAKYKDGNITFEAEEGKVAVYGRNRNKLILLPVMLVLFTGLFIFGATYSYNEDFRDKVDRFYINTFKVEKATPPTIVGGSKEYAKERIIKVVKDGINYSGISHYEYCVTENENFDNCEWQETLTKNARVFGNGKYNVVFRAVSKEGTKGSLSNTETVYVDNETPVIKTVSLVRSAANTKNLKVTTKAEDALSGVGEYFYKIDNGAWQKVDKVFEVEGLQENRTYNITVRVIDKVGNYTEVSQNFRLRDLAVETVSNSNTTDPDGNGNNGENGENGTNPGGNGNGENGNNNGDNGNNNNGNNGNNNNNNNNDDNNNNNGNNNGNENGNNGNENGDNTGGNNGDNNGGNTGDNTGGNTGDNTGGNQGGNTGGDNNDDDKKDEEDKRQAPEINLDEVPLVFEYGENYELPSYYKFDEQGGEVECLIDNSILATDTSRMMPGKHTISCEARGNNGLTTRVEKEVEVTIEISDDEYWDGYILLNLYYPENSTERMWRLGKEGEIRTGYEDDGWKDYTGPILVKIDDIENIYIKYKLDGEEIIQAPNGRLLVDIQPEKFTIDEGKTTKVKIVFDETSETKEVRINNGQWQTYEESFEVGPNTLIEARASKIENVYDKNGNLIISAKITGTDSVFVSQTVPTGGNVSGSTGSNGTDYETSFPDPTRPGHTTPTPDSKPSTYLAGPTINATPTYVTKEAVTVTITTEKPEDTRAIYYRINSGEWEKYSEAFSIDYNCTIEAYYITESDGQTSTHTNKRISNIWEGQAPYVRIDAKPDPYIESSTDSVTISITGRDYNTLEYSLDGIYYEKYTTPFVITTSKTIYARATNAYGTTYDRLVVNNLKAVKTEKLDVNIIVKKPAKNIQVDKTTVTISYDAKATTRLYKIGSNGTWHEYNEPFEVSQNTTIYAYAKAENAVGTDTKSIDFLQLGLTDPVIKASPAQPSTASEVNVTIDYDNTATVKQYKIDNGEWQTYNGSFKVRKNCTIYAHSEDTLENKADATYQIQNVVPNPPVLIIKHGMYFLIKLNYPPISNPKTREYKWKKDGTWKLYKESGILLIKPEYKDILLDLEGNVIIKIEDENGNLIEFNGDYYFLDVPVYEISENLYMRWDAQGLSAPTILVNPENEWAQSVSIGVVYPEVAEKKEYKLIYEDGTTTGWLTYNGAITIKQNNVIVQARYQNALKTTSAVAQKIIQNVDGGNPGIRYINVTKTTQNSISIEVDGIDEISGIKTYYYSLNGEDYTSSESNTYTFSDLYANSSYKIYVYVEDNAGNMSSVYSIIGSTNNINPPIVQIEPGLEEWSQNKKITLSHTDEGIILYYSFDKGKTWIEYKTKADSEDEESEEFEEGIIVTESTDFIAKAFDGRNERLSESYYIDTVDSTKPVIEEVTVVPRSNRLIVSVKAKDNESGVKLYYYSVDGENYEESYENTYTITGLDLEKEYTVYVKVKNTVGLESEVEEVEIATTELGDFAYFIKPAANKWAYEKEIIVDYPIDEEAGYLNQYSTDKGKTWLTYTGPILLTEEDQTILVRILDGTKTKTSSSIKITWIDTTEPTISLDGLPEFFYTYEEYSVPSSYTVNEEISSGKATCMVNGQEYTNTNQLPGGTYTIECSVTTGAGRSASVSKNVTVVHQEIKEVDSILEGLQDPELESGYYIFKVTTEEEEVKYPIHLYTFDTDQIWNTDQTFGDINDVAKANKDAQYMVAVKVNGNLTVGENATITPFSTEYGGPKGFTLYVTGTLENNGTIDNSHGARAEGQNVYLWKNANDNYEFVSKKGGSGGTSVSGDYKAGIKGTNGTERSTGGGGSGATHGGTSGSGASGTSYSGGAGGGSGSGSNTTAGEANGGAGGNGNYGGGSGNPGGSKGANAKDATAGGTGTGGLLIIYAGTYENKGTISANGKDGGTGFSGGGSSGGGSINLFINNDDLGIHQTGIITNEQYSKILGKTSVTGGGTFGTSNKGGAGGTGTVNIGQIRDGQYCDLKECIDQDKEAYKQSITKTGDSILSILEKNEFEEGESYWNFKVNDEEYSVHLYTFNTNQNWTTSKTFGNLDDIATDSRDAQNMVIVKVKGNVTVGENAKITPFSTEYGGPKGFALYVTGTLENNGTIDNSHGAKAEGQNVYLWKNTDDNYEFVPKKGGAGGTSVSGDSKAGIKGTNGTERSTGGGGSGASHGSTSGTGASGTSYSGGSGGGSAYAINGNGGNASTNGGAGGGSGSSTSSSGGAGNPGGSKGANAKDETAGGNGTGGLLVIYAGTYENKGIISANGKDGGTGYTGGGSSGGGSINLFINNDDLGIHQTGIITNEQYSKILGKTSVTGGGAVGTSNKGGAGGTGTVNIGQIRDGQYCDLKECIDQDKESYKQSITKTGDSILSILEKNEFEEGESYLNFKVNDEDYSVHLYTFNNDQNWTTSRTFGNLDDIATDSRDAQNMVIVKVKGDLTIGSGVKIQPTYNTYGGPKGFTLYVTGTLENNGTIDNSHGAKAEGQNVYLWKNTDDNYEFVPKKGGAGGTSVSGDSKVGIKGTNGTERSTGGGGSGASHGSSKSGSGAAGTSYSGGSGGGSAYSSNNPGGNASINGGIGGAGGYYGGGAGNPGGANGKGTSSAGGNGTGGLLVIYAGTYANNNTISAKGADGGTGYTGGGSSGGGSINIFYRTLITKGTSVSAAGGSAVGTSKNGGAGGTGTITYKEITFPEEPITLSDDTEEETSIPNPTFKITASTDEQKQINISYPQGNYEKEYSLDNGITWEKYTKEIDIQENTTIIARTVQNGKVVSSSTIKITTIGNEEQTEPENEPITEEQNEVIEEELLISMDIPDTIEVGSSYSLPTTSTGETTTCTIDGVEYQNTSELQPGKYTISCITTKDETSKEITKEIEITETLGG